MAFWKSPARPRALHARPPMERRSQHVCELEFPADGSGHTLNRAG